MASISSSRCVTVAALQMKCSANSLENIEKAEGLVRDAVAAGAEVVLIQELFEGPYFCIDQLASHFAKAGPADMSNPLLARMSKLASSLNVVLPVSFFESSAGSFFNSMVYITCLKLLFLFHSAQRYHFILFYY
jgi:N-carbamoylputrescine amidase